MIRGTTKTRAKVWKVTPTEKYIDITLSTSAKGVDGNYINSRWYARAIGHAMNALKDIKVGDVITVKEFQISNVSKKLDDGEWKTYLDVVLTDADVGFANGNVSTAAATQPQKPAATAKPATVATAVSGDEIPW